MNLIKPKFEILEQQSGVDGIYKMIELAGRTCYRSEDKITEDSAKEFVDRMIKSGHGAMLEHGTVYLYLPWVSIGGIDANYSRNKYSKSIFYSNTVYDKDGNTSFIPIEYGKAGHYITTNLRVLVENGWMDDLKYLCEPTEYHEKRVTVKFTCDRVTGESFLRHRAIDEDHPTIEGEVTREMEKDIDSFARESTRYCNYTKDKFNSEFTIITPPEFYDKDINGHLEYWGNDDDYVFRTMCSNIAETDDHVFELLDTWYFANLATQWAYHRLIELGWKPQQARRVIPLDIKSPLVMTGFISDWKHFFELRCAPNAHPQARELAIPLKEEFIKRGYIND